MAFKTNEFQQINLFDPVYTMSDRNKRFLEKSWEKSFADIVFPKINEEHFSVLYICNAASRPNTPVNVLIGSLLIKEMFGLTDEELMESIFFDIRYQYALHTTVYKEQPFSDRTFSRFRSKANAYEEATGIDLIQEEILSLADVIVKSLGINPTMKRMDSIMIASSCKRMSRLELFYTCVSNVVQLLHRLGNDDMLKKFEHYLEDNDKNDVIYRCKPNDTDQRLSAIAKDAVSLLTLMDAKIFETFEEYQNLNRLVNDQIIINSSKITLKESKTISTTSLQNPSVSEASYRFKAGKKHIGYVGNFVESFDENGAVITQFDYQQNIHADHSFCEEVIDELGPQETKVTMIADGAYSGMDNIEKAKNNNIELITTALTGPAPSDIHSSFKIDRKQHEIISCPMGYKPEYYNHNQKRNDYRILFTKQHCKNCPNREKCNAKIQQKTAVVKLSQNMIDRANYIKSISTTEYIELQKKRNGVEGIPSVLRRKYNIDRIPVRGFIASKLWYSFKIGAINIKRLLKALKEQICFVKLSINIIKIQFTIMPMVTDEYLLLLLTP